MKKYIPILGIIVVVVLIFGLFSMQQVIPTEERLPTSSSLLENDKELLETSKGTTDIPTEDYPIISMDDVIISMGTTESVDVQLINATGIVICALNITWDPSVINLVAVDDSTSDFASMYVNYDNNIGFVRIDTYYDDYIGLVGDGIICSLEFEPAVGAVDGDSCWINTTESTIYSWNRGTEVVCNTVDNAVAEIDGDIDAFIYLSYGSIPIDGQGYVTLNTSCNDNLGFMGVNISWDTSVANFILFDTAMTDFDTVHQYVNITQGYLRVDAYAMSTPASGDNIIVGAIHFEPAPSAQGNDWCWLEFTESDMWDNDTIPIPHISYDGSVTIIDDSCSGSVSGYVYNDLNENGTKDTGEPGLENWLVSLNETQVLTDSQGYYEFTSICPGPYIVQETIVSGWTNTSASSVYVNINENDATVDFGNKYISSQEICVEKSVRKACCDVYDSTGIVVYDYEEQWVIFKLEITGSGTYEFVTISDFLPNRLVFNETYSSSQGWPIPSQMGSELIWNLGNKQGDWMETIYFRCEILDGPCDSLVNNMVEVRGINSCEDTDIATDNAWVDLQCEPSDPPELHVTKLVKENCDGPFLNEVDIPYDDYVTYKVVVELVNSDALSLVVRDNLPQLDGLVYNNSYVLDSEGSYIPPSDYTFEITDDYLFWNFTYFMPGFIEIYYCAEAIGCDEYENTVNVSAHLRPCCPDAWLFEEDSAIVDIICPSGVRMDKKVSLDGVTWSDGPVETVLNDIIWFKLNITNIGFEPVGGVDVTDTLPFFLTLVEVVDDDYAVNQSTSNQSLAWFYGNINAQDSKVIIFKVKVIDIGTGYNIACAKDCNSSLPWCDEVEIIIEEGMHVEKLVSIDHLNWVDNVTVTTGDMVWWNLTVSYYTSSDLVLYYIVVNDTLPHNVTYVNNSAVLYHSDGWSKLVNPENDNSFLTWDLSVIDDPQAVLQNNEWLSITFATTIGMEINGTLENIVNVTAMQCNDTILFDEDSAFINITEIINHPPTIASPQPEQDAENVSVDPTLQVTVDDADDDFLSIVFYNASDDSEIQSYAAINPPQNVTASWNNLDYNTTYSWYVNVSDGTTLVTSPIYTFTTEEEPDNLPPDMPTDPSPGHGTSNVDRNPWLSVHVSDPDGDEMTVTFYDASDDSIIGTDTCTNDCTASVKWTNLDFSTSYTWYVIVSDGEFSVTSSNWLFSTESPDVDLDIGLSGGFGIRLDIENIGTDTATDVEWEMTVKSVSIFRNINNSYGAAIADIEGGYQTYQTVSIFKLFARVEVNAIVTCAESSPVELTKNAIILGPFVII